MKTTKTLFIQVFMYCLIQRHLYKHKVQHKPILFKYQLSGPQFYFDKHDLL